VRQVLKDGSITGLMVDLWLVSDVLSLTAKFMREPSGATCKATPDVRCWGLLIVLSATEHANSL
jgi:hypothetical protein